MPENKEKNEKEKILYTDEGYEIEGFGNGGKVKIVKRDQPDFMKIFSPISCLVFAFNSPSYLSLYWKLNDFNMTSFSLKFSLCSNED